MTDIDRHKLAIDVIIKPVKPITYCRFTFGPMPAEEADVLVASIQEWIDSNG